MTFDLEKCEIIDELVINHLEELAKKEGYDVQPIIDWIAINGTDWDEVKQDLLEQSMLFEQNLWDQDYVEHCSECGIVLDEGWYWKEDSNLDVHEREWFCEDCALGDIALDKSYKRRLEMNKEEQK